MLAVRDLWVTPSGAPDAVVRGVSFDLASGEWLAVTGANGCGKTTLALAAAGLLTPSRGTIQWMGRPASERGVRSGVPPVLAVLQDPSTQLLQPTVAEELRFTATNLGIPADEVERNLAQVGDRLGMAGIEALDPQTLSAGWQQIVLIAAALVARPGLLVADEPGAHLDPGARGRLLDLIAEQTGRGLAVLWVTQNPDEVSRATRAIRLGEVPETEDVKRVPIRQGAPVVRIRIRACRSETGPRIRICEDLELGLPGPGLLALEGPNGSGKSVLLGAISGVESCDQVELHFENPTGPPPLLVGQYPELMIFQERVEDEIAFAAVSRGLARARVLEHAARLLQVLELDPAILGRQTWDLSTGEKRLVELVAALVAPAGILALDEPTGGLDSRKRQVLAGLVRDRARESAVLVASQDTEWVEGLGGIRGTLGAPAAPPSIGKKRD